MGQTRLSFAVSDTYDLFSKSLLKFGRDWQIEAINDERIRAKDAVELYTSCMADQTRAKHLFNSIGARIDRQHSREIIDAEAIYEAIIRAQFQSSQDPAPAQQGDGQNEPISQLRR